MAWIEKIRENFRGKNVQLKPLGYEEYSKLNVRKFVYTTLILEFLLTVTIIGVSIMERSYNSLTFYIAAIFVFPIIFVTMKIFSNIFIGIYFNLTFFIMAVVFGIINSSLGNVAVLMPILFPTLAFYMLGRSRGIRAIAVFLLIYTVNVVLILLRVIDTIYNYQFLLIALFMFGLTSILTYFYANRHEKIEAAMSRQLYEDALTKLPNRQKLLRDINLSISPVLFLINIDDFKEINDILGHQTGDDVLLLISKKLQLLISNPQIKIYKLSGDEFALIFDLQNEEFDYNRVIKIAELITSKINNEKFTHKNQRLIVRVTIGISAATIVKKENVLTFADIALKTAKENKKNYLFYKDASKTRTNYKNNLKRLNLLSWALEHDSVMPFFQPILDHKTNKIVKYECLLRLKDPGGNIISPFFILDIAKKTRLYPFLTEIMLRKSAKVFERSQKEFAINLSVDDFSNPEIIRQILNILHSTPSLRKRMTFEILESEGIENYSEVTNFINAVKYYGCKVAIDDFGSGYSNFEYLIKLDIDYIKLDGSIIKNIDIDRNSEIIVRNVVNFARELNLKTVAEYVHSKEVFEKVKSIGIDYSQGYYIGKPTPLIEG